MRIKAGMTVWSTTLDCKVEVVAVYKQTATVRAWGGGLMVDKQMTFRGQRLDSLEPFRRQRTAQQITALRGLLGRLAK